MQTITTQGVDIPRLGFGTFRMPGAECQPVVESALALGYRQIDTAAMAAAALPREELFITTKVWHDQLGSRDAILRAFAASLAKLKLKRVDLYMGHWPSADMDMGIVMETLMDLRERGRTRAIGVSNFNMPMIRAAIEDIGAPIAALQVEYYPFLD